MDMDKIWPLINHPVRVDLDTGYPTKGEFTYGNLVTVDPESGSVILALFNNGSDVKSFEMIPKYAVKNIVGLDTLNESCARYSEEIEQKINEYLKVHSSSVRESAQDIENRRKKIIDYLRSHHIDVNEGKNGEYLICGTVKLTKPYRKENFYCDIPMVLQRILNMVDKIGT